MSDLHRELLDLLREKSVRYGEFTLASGKTSDFYVDARQTTLHARGAAVVAELGGLPARDPDAPLDEAPFL